MLVTEAIALEHATLLRVIKEVRRVLPQLRSALEVGTMATMLEGLLGRHGELETEFAFLPLDHTLRHKKALNLLHHDHQEVNDRFRQVHQAATCERARQLLRAALRISQDHFYREERDVLPLLELTLGHGALRALGDAFKARSRLKHVRARRPRRATRSR